MLDDRAWNPPDRWKVSQDNLKRLQNEMKINGIDVFFLNRSDAVRYVTGTVPSDNLIFSQRVACLVLAENEQPILLAQSHGASSLRGVFWITDIRPLPRIQIQWPDLVEKTIIDYGLNPKKCRIGLDATMEAYPFDLLKNKFPNASCAESWNILTRCRAIKSKDEISSIEHACILGEMSIDAGVNMIKIGLKEIELSAEMSRVALAAGAEGLYARRGTAVTSGDKFARHDETPSNRRLRYGDLILMDVGPIVNGYYTDFARTVCLGKPSINACKAYTTAYNALQMAIKLFKPGVEGVSVSQEVVQYINKAYPEGKISGLSFAVHGIGTAPQEPPYFVPIESTGKIEGFEIVEPGMTLSLAAGAYDHIRIGCRLEEVIVITETGNRILSNSPYYGFEKLYLN